MAIGDYTRIYTNLNALNTLNALKTVNKALSTNQLRLSTGLRISSAADDPAGFVISKRLEARSRGLSTALDNVSTAENVLAIAEGGLNNISDILITIKEKVTQAASDTLSTSERNAIRSEINELTEEIDNIIEETTFNDRELLGGTYTGISIQTGPEPGNVFQIDISQNSSVEGLGIQSSAVANQLTTASAASAALSTVDEAIEKVTNALQEVGAYVSRLQVKESTLSVAITTTEATRSRIVDADIAKEQLEATKNLILQQMAIAQLVQANITPRNLLKLFE